MCQVKSKKGVLGHGEVFTAERDKCDVGFSEAGNLVHKISIFWSLRAEMVIY